MIELPKATPRSGLSTAEVIGETVRELRQAFGERITQAEAELRGFRTLGGLRLGEVVIAPLRLCQFACGTLPEREGSIRSTLLRALQHTAQGATEVVSGATSSDSTLRS